MSMQAEATARSGDRDGLPRGDPRGARRRARRGSDRGLLRRGRRQRRRRVQDQRRACPRPRAGARLQHADLRELVHRHGPRHGGDRPAPGGRDHVQRFPADGGRRDCQRAAEVPLHVGRPGVGPVTIRSMGGGTGRFGTQHSATGESWYMGLPASTRHRQSRPGDLLDSAHGDPLGRSHAGDRAQGALQHARARSRAPTMRRLRWEARRCSARGPTQPSSPPC